MLAPLIPYEIRGAIWYQGESNRYDPELYKSLMPALIENWRKQWQRNLPFYFVQLAPFSYQEPMVGAGLREAQLQTALSVPKTGLVVSADVGNPSDIHPRDKQTIGQRLALQALSQTYDRELIANGPILEKSVRDGAKMKLYFTEANGPIKLSSSQYFEIAGEDQKFYPATPKIIDQNILELSSPEVNAPVAARYAFNNAAEASLFNETGLPASPFRTDDWPLFYGPARLDISYQGQNKRYQVRLLYPASQKHELRYTLDGTLPNASSPIYEGPIAVELGQVLQVRAFQGTLASPYLLEQSFTTHMGMLGVIASQNAGSSRYAASGEYALIDGLLGSLNYQDGKWRGYNGSDLEITLDLGKRVSIDSISTHFLINQAAWIYGPSLVEVEISNNGKNYQSVLAQNLNSEKAVSATEILPIQISLDGRRARFIRLKAKPLAQLPDYHPGAGKAAWMFVDELVVK